MNFKLNQKYNKAVVDCSSLKETCIPKSEEMVICHRRWKREMDEEVTSFTSVYTHNIHPSFASKGPSWRPLGDKTWLRAIGCSSSGKDCMQSLRQPQSATGVLIENPITATTNLQNHHKCPSFSPESPFHFCLCVLQVNGVNIEGMRHAEVVAFIKKGGDATWLLVVDPETDEEFKRRGIVPAVSHVRGRTALKPMLHTLA